MLATFRRSVPRPGMRRSTLRVELLEDRATPCFSITDLGTLGGTTSFALGVNNWGQVVGYSQTARDESTHAFRYDTSGGMTDLGTLTAEGVGYGLATNDIGNVVGYASIPGGNRAFLHDGSRMIDLGTLGGRGSAGLSVNVFDMVVGYSYPRSVETYWHAFFYYDGFMIDLGTFGGDYSSANDINNSGLIVGFAQRDDGYARAFVFDWKEMHDLGTLGGNQSFADAINEQGQVVGYAETATDGNHAFLYSESVMYDLGPGRAFDINSLGQAVGSSRSGPFLYSEGVVYDLNSLLPSGSGWVLNEARGINDSGQIVGTGIINNREHAYLMTPDCDGGLPAPGNGQGMGNRADEASALLLGSFEDAVEAAFPRQFANPGEPVQPLSPVECRQDELESPTMQPFRVAALDSRESDFQAFTLPLFSSGVLPVGDMP